MENKNLQISVWLIQSVALIIGASVSLVGYFNAREKEAVAMLRSAETRDFEARRPLLELRQKYYVEALEAAGVLATSANQIEAEVVLARRRFEQLYWAVLALVEDGPVAGAMVQMLTILKSSDRTGLEAASLGLAHAMQKSLADSWIIRHRETPK